MDEKLTELVRKREELYDMSNRNCGDSVWEERLWVQTGEELKKNQASYNVFFFHCAF